MRNHTDSIRLYGRNANVNVYTGLQQIDADNAAWPVPDPATLDRAVALDVDGITTDNPHLLQPVR